jgi:tRNA(adenine34) deaminase
VASFAKTNVCSMDKDMSENTTPMRTALEEARLAQARDEVPIGAVVTDEGGRIIARAGNETRHGTDPTAHAEILAIRRAALALGTDRLRECTLYVTLEPCAMCAGAIAHARLKRLVFGAYDPKGGAVEHGPRFFEQATCLHRPEILGGIDDTICGDMLRLFFEAKR